MFEEEVRQALASEAPDDIRTVAELFESVGKYEEALEWRRWDAHLRRSDADADRALAVCHKGASLEWGRSLLDGIPQGSLVRGVVEAALMAEDIPTVQLCSKLFSYEADPAEIVDLRSIPADSEPGRMAEQSEALGQFARAALLWRLEHALRPAEATRHRLARCRLMVCSETALEAARSWRVHREIADPLNQETALNRAMGKDEMAVAYEALLRRLAQPL